MLSHIPLWVPPLLLLLIVIGWRQSRTRWVRPGVLASVALGLAAWSLFSLRQGFGPGMAAAWAAGAWLPAYAAVLARGGRPRALQGLVAEQSAGRLRVQVPGSWLPLGLLLAVFGLKFGLGVAAGLRSPLLQQPLFAACMGGLLGALAGGLGARALAVQRCVRLRRA